MITLRPYQDNIISEVRSDMTRGIKRPLIVAPCGSGKTVIMAWMAAASALKGNTVWFLVHRQELIDQSSKTFTEMGIRHGIISPGSPSTRDRIQIGSVFTVGRRLKKLVPPDLVIMDEAHHATAGTWRKIVDTFPKAWFIGLTATPLRLNGDGLGDIYDRIVLGPSVKQLVALGNLAPYRYYAPPVVADLDGLKVKYGDYQAGDVTLRMDQPEIIGNAIEHYKTLANGKRAIAYCTGVEHSKHTAQAFTAAGIPAAHIDGDTDPLTRKATIDRFRSGDIKVLCNVDLISEGFDVPSMEAVILLRPTASTGLYIQQSMRPMRIDSDNPAKVAIIIDHVGNVYRHGLPDEDREWSLEGRKKRAAQAGNVMVKQCPKCYAAHAPGPICPFCGYVYPPSVREGPQEKPGSLAEVLDVKRRQKALELRKARTKEDFERIAIERGYKLQWVKYAMEARRLR